MHRVRFISLLNTMQASFDVCHLSLHFYGRFPFYSIVLADLVAIIGKWGVLVLCLPLTPSLCSVSLPCGDGSFRRS